MTFLSHVTDAVFITNAQLEFMHANRAALDMLGYNQEELIGRRVADTIVAEAGWIEEQRSHLMAEGEWAGEVRALRKDGRPMKVRAWAMAMRSRRGPKYIAVIGRKASGRRPVGAVGARRRVSAYDLTSREDTILRLLANGLTDKEIASELGVSAFTVHKHVSNILHKMKASGRTEAAVRAQREGLV